LSKGIPLHYEKVIANKKSSAESIWDTQRFSTGLENFSWDTWTNTLIFEAHGANFGVWTRFHKRRKHLKALISNK
jgi:hypothetical protein